MDIPKIPLELLTAGKDYDAALRKLGLHADAINWGWDTEDEQFQLFLIWGGFDKFGPLAIGELLFKAYRATALPQSIDPFSVRVFSPKHPLSKEFFFLEEGSSRTQMRFTQGMTDDVKIHWQGDWVISQRARPRKSLEISRDWRRFNERVNALAA